MEQLNPCELEVVDGNRQIFIHNFEFGGSYFRTMFTIRPGITMTLVGALPSSRATIFSSANAVFSTSSFVASAGTVMRLRTLPLTWMG